MSLEETFKTISLWINSCIEDRQLDLCEEVIFKLLERRFYMDHLMPFKADELRDLIKHKRSKINSLHFINQES